MDFNSFVNKESFKAILLQHLKNQVKTKFSPTISQKVQENIESEELIPSDAIVNSVSNDILHSEKFPEFLNSFLGNVNYLLEDKDNYVPKTRNNASSSQCSSASSINASSIDFLRPDQFQNIMESLTSGTNAERLEALSTLHRLPTMEHLMHHFSWADVEEGLHNSLASDIIFLKDESLKFYIKMLSCAESKVVLESYLSLIKYFLQVLLPSVNKNFEKIEDFIRQCRRAVEILSILNKFLQNISTHWLRYPQSVIESITIQSLSILSASINNSRIFPIWMCIAECDPEAKWLKSIMHGHVSRASLLEALSKDLNILRYVVTLCDNFYSYENYLFLHEECCQKPYLITDITHILCFLSHLLQYSEGRKLLSYEPNEKYLSSWVNVLDLVMKCVYKLCCNACFNCCRTACDTVSKKWHYLLCNNDLLFTVDDIILVLESPLSKDDINFNIVYFIMQCICETINSLYNAVDSIEFETNVNNFVLKLLSKCTNLYLDCDFINEIAAAHLCNSSLILVKKLLLMPSSLFFNSDFINILTEWWLKIKHLAGTNCSSVNKHIFSEISKNISDISICLLHKPFSITLSHNLSLFETNLNVLLEKILSDIKFRGSVCPCDVSKLSTALNSTISLKYGLNKTIVFRLSTVIWQLNEASDNMLENSEPLKCILEILLSSIFCEVASSEMINSSDLSSENNLFQCVLLFPNLSMQSFISEDYNILALQVISLLSSSIHSICVLQTKFDTANMLLDAQANYDKIDDKIVIDPISILQNHILAKLYVIGGSNEKNLPDEILQNNSDSYEWPFITEYPVTNVFYGFKDNGYDVSKIFEDMLNGNFRIRYLEEAPQTESRDIDSVFPILKIGTDALQSDLTYPLNHVSLDAANSELQNEELIGISLTQRYGKQLNLIADDDENKLKQLLKAVKHLIGSDKSSKLDIFACTIFLICKGDIETAWLTLQDFAKSSNSVFIWRELMIRVSENIPKKCVTLPCAILEWCDIIIKKTFPSLFSAFEFCGILPSVIYNQWTIQCYWNYLDFYDVAHFVLFNVLFSGEFTLYFFASVLKHLHTFILEHAHSNNLYSLLMKNPIHDFKVYDCMDFMNSLASTFHEPIWKTVKEILQDEINNS
ncbi:protein broad-minded [Caerostris darwini]|uniref:Protein broad-minded n=1 Tax=Caerostris darwini TaxID=1538125 RepID=A0AAV4N863_9ARAC|nr:protein broad-minded [Caerostris darwini]